MRKYPQRGFSRAIRTINSLTSLSSGGRPVRGRPLNAAHRRRTSSRCLTSKAAQAERGSLSGASIHSAANPARA